MASAHPTNYGILVSDKYGLTKAALTDAWLAFSE